jgi:hypothetical protein
LTIYYRLQEGRNDESYISQDISHEKRFTQKEFDDMCNVAKKEVKEVNDFVDPIDVATAMCDLYGFKTVEPLLVHNTDS